MRLGIDAREIQNGIYTGIGRPLANFLEYFAGLDNDDTCVLFSSQKILLDFGPKVKNAVISEKITFLWDQWQLPQALRQEHIEVFYSPYYKMPLLKPCPTVSAILDLMYLSFKPYYRQLPVFKKLYYAIFGRLYAWRADQILTCSKYSMGDILRIWGVDANKIKLIPLSLGNNYRPQPGQSPVQGRYILYVGNFKLHKNVSMLLEAFGEIAGSFPDLKLVLAGPHEHTYQQLVETVQNKGLQGRVLFLGKISEEDHPQNLYSGAEVFVMPSLYEGFGLPPLEAMACGVAVVASNATSIPEVIKDAGILVDPTDAHAMADAITKVLTNQGLKDKMIEQGLKRSREYESLKISAQMYEFLKSLCT